MTSDLTVRGARTTPKQIGDDAGRAADQNPQIDKTNEPWRPWSQRDLGIEGAKAKKVAPRAGPARAKDLFPHALAVNDVATVEKSASVLAKMLDCPELREVAERVGNGLKGNDRERFGKAMGAFALLADTALTTLDYDRLSTGWDGWSNFGFKYPSSRSQYRERRYRYDLDTASKPRQERSRTDLLEAVGRALDAENPTDALEAALGVQFLAEVGISAETRQGWKPNAEAIASALEKESVIPLRALYAAAAHLDHRDVPLKGHTERELNQACRELMETVIRHVAEGDFADWRFEHPASRVQLAPLTPEQEATYRADTSVERETYSGHKLKTRDARGLDLLWVTKIGGPSHGFDMLSQCLFPLLANARNGAIIVDDEDHPGAARSTLRLLPTANGKPVLFLEMLQVDYPYERMPVERAELREAIIAHALQKARAMDIPLAIAPSKFEQAEGLLKRMKAKGERQRLELVLEPSAGIFEASDTLLGAHHRPQTGREVIRFPDRVPMISMSSPYPCVVR